MEPRRYSQGQNISLHRSSSDPVVAAVTRAARWLTEPVHTQLHTSETKSRICTQSPVALFTSCRSCAGGGGGGVGFARSHFLLGGSRLTRHAARRLARRFSNQQFSTAPPHRLARPTSRLKGNTEYLLFTAFSSSSGAHTNRITPLYYYGIWILLIMISFSFT